MSNNIYNILNKLQSLTPQEPATAKQENKQIYESVEARGSVLEGVSKVEQTLAEKYMGFKKTVAAIKKGGSAENPEAVAAAIGRKKYGKAKFQKAAAAGKKLGEGDKPHPKELEIDADVRSMQIQQRADQAEKKLAAKRAEPKNIFQKVKKDIGEPLKKLAKGDIRGSLSEEPNEEMLSPRDKKFAALAEPKDKITYADKIAGAKKKTEGNKFTGNLMKARAQGKKEADLDGDGDMERVHEGFDDMEKYLKTKQGPQPKGGSGKVAGKRYGGAAQKDDEGDKEEATADAPKKKGRPKKDKFAEDAMDEAVRGTVFGKQGYRAPQTQGERDVVAQTIKQNRAQNRADTRVSGYGSKIAPQRGVASADTGGARGSAVNVDQSGQAVDFDPGRGNIDPQAQGYRDSLNLGKRSQGKGVAEKAPPGAKAERMVKHIKKGYAKDGKLTPKEKSIAFATAWKAHNKGKLDEAVIYEGGDQQLDHILNRFKNEVKRFQAGEHLDDDLYMALFDYYMDQGEIPYGIAKARDGDPYQWIGDRLSDYLDGTTESVEKVQPKNSALGVDALSPAEKLAPHAGVGKGPIGKAIGSAVTTAKNVGRFIQGKPEIPTLEDQELNELAKLAGLSEAKVKSKVDECGPGTMSPMSTMGQDEGSLSINTSMNSDGTKSVSVNATGNQADALAQMLKMAGIGSTGKSAATSDEQVEEERDIEYANTPEEETETVDAIVHQGNDLNREKEQYADRPKSGDNPMATPTRESVEMPKKISRMLEGIKKFI